MFLILGGGYYSAVSTASLPADRETKWKVTIGSIGCYIMIAVVSNPHLDANRYNDPTICGWFNNGEVYGVRADNNQWNGFRANDVLHLSYNPNTAQLSLTKDNTVHTLSVTKNCEYYHYCIFSGIGTVTYEIL